MSSASRGMPLIERTADWSRIRDALAAVQKSNRNAQAYSRWVNRPFGRVLAATAYKLGLSPNAISVISACFTFPAIVLVATLEPSWWAGLLIAGMLIVGYALDSADGQVARLQGGGSLSGEWLDHVLDSAKASGFHLAVAVLWVKQLGEWPLWTTMVPLLFVFQASVWFFAMILTDLLLRNAGVKKLALAADEERQGILVSLLGIPADYGFLCLTMVLIGWFESWRWIYLLLAGINLALLGLQLIRWYTRVAAVDRSAPPTSPQS